MVNPAHPESHGGAGVPPNPITNPNEEGLSQDILDTIFNSPSNGSLPSTEEVYTRLTFYVASASDLKTTTAQTLMTRVNAIFDRHMLSADELTLQELKDHPEEIGQAIQGAIRALSAALTAPQLHIFFNEYMQLHLEGSLQCPMNFENQGTLDPHARDAIHAIITALENIPANERTSVISYVNQFLHTSDPENNEDSDDICPIIHAVVAIPADQRENVCKLTLLRCTDEMDGTKVGHLIRETTSLTTPAVLQHVTRLISAYEHLFPHQKTPPIEAEDFADFDTTELQLPEHPEQNSALNILKNYYSEQYAQVPRLSAKPLMTLAETKTIIATIQYYTPGECTQFALLLAEQPTDQNLFDIVQYCTRQIRPIAQPKTSPSQRPRPPGPPAAGSRLRPEGGRAADPRKS